jgi:hypothetical protein
MRLVGRTVALLEVSNAQMRRQMNLSAHAPILRAPSRNPYNTPNKTLTLSIGGQMRAPSGNMDGHVKTGPKMSVTETIIAMSAAALSGASNLVMMPNTSYEG